MEIRYIGKTVVTPKIRLKCHRRCANDGKISPVYSWMRKHGPENIEFTVLEFCDESDIDNRERYWISQYPNLTNIMNGGQGTGTWTLEERLRRSALMKKLCEDPEFKNRIAPKGRKWSDERRASSSERSAKIWATRRLYNQMRDAALDDVPLD